MAVTGGNVAWGTVATPPTPATTGVAFVLTAGHGARFTEAVPYPVTLYNPETVPDVSNTEIGTCTARSGDSLTITRNTEPLPGGSAQPVAAGWRVAATVTKATLDGIAASVRSFFDVRSYAAALNDSTDDSTPVQNAINAASAAGGGTVLIPGRCLISGGTTLTVPSNVIIRGTGWENSWLRHASGATVPLLDFSGTATGGGTHTHHQGLADITLRGSGSTGTLLRAYYSDRLRCTDAFFYDSTGIGCDLVELWDSRFTRCAWNSVGGTYSGTTTDTPGANSAKPQVWIRNSAAASGFGNGTDNSNMIWFTDCHWEDYESGALWIERGHTANASNPNGIFVTHGKFETHRTRNISIVVGDQASLVHFRDIDVVHGAFDSGVSTAVLGMLIGGVSNIAVDGARFVLSDGVASMSAGIEWYGQTAGAYRISGISHEGTNPTAAVVAFGGMAGRYDLGVVSSAAAVLFSGTHPENRTLTFAATLNPVQNARRVTNRVTLTGNVTTLNVPSDRAQPGDLVRFEFTQDGTGGRTVAFAAGYKVAWSPTTTANKLNVIEFEFNGTNWVQVSEKTNL